MTELRQNFNKLKQLILASEQVLISCHEKPDGDALGSMLALSYYLDELNKPSVCYAREKLIEPYYFLPGIERIKNKLDNIQSFDLILIIDAGDIRRTGIFDELGKVDSTRTKIVNIDHHLTVLMDWQDKTELSIINLEVSSVSEIVYQFFEQTNAFINKEIATHLLTGILTDTGCFSNLGTTVNSFSVAAKLLNKGANLKKICDNTLKNNNIISLRLWGRALARLEKNPETGIVTSIITQKDIEECGASDDSTEGISNFLNFLSDAKFTLLLKEEKEGRVKGSLRTTRDDVDVSKIAARFGGGGHKKAAGFSVKGKLVKTEEGWKIK